MKMEDLISIIIPVYNAQDFLSECLESVINQTYENIEIILIDDGSNDNSATLCNQYAMQDKRIVFIRQENHGNTNARKNGLKIAKGKYILFVDADDFVKRDMTEVLYRAIKENDADIVLSNVIKCQSYGDFVIKNKIPEGTYDNMDEIIPNMFYFEDSKEFGVLPYLYAKLYKKEFIEEAFRTLSDEMQYAEDRAVMFWCMIHAKRAVFLNEEYYYYRIHDGSICTSNDEEFLIKLTRFYQYSKRLFETCKEKEHLLKQLDRYMMDGVIYGINRKIGLSQNDLILKYILNDNKLPASDKVILYGAGAVGRDYYKQLKRSKKVNLVAWVDQNSQKYIEEGLEVKPITEIAKLDFEYILVAVRRENLLENISKVLLEEYSVSSDKILWIQPDEIF